MAKCDKARIIIVESRKTLGGEYMGIYCKFFQFCCRLENFYNKKLGRKSYQPFYCNNNNKRVKDTCKLNQQLKQSR